jgi:uroporphyrinogen III methyltransferase / synthase
MDSNEKRASELPLYGRRVIVTRAARQARDLARELRALGAEVTCCPMIEVREPASWSAVDSALERLHRFDWLFFTSVNGVEYFLRRLDEVKHDRSPLGSLKIAAVGRKTRERLEDEGLTVELQPDRFTAGHLAEQLVTLYRDSERLKGLRILLPGSDISRDVIRPGLARFGADVELVEAYRTVRPDVGEEQLRLIIDAPRGDYIIFTSPSTVVNLGFLLGADDLGSTLAGLRVVCIGPVTADAARRHGLDVDLQPGESSVDAIVRLLIADQRRTPDASIT